MISAYLIGIAAAIIAALFGALTWSGLTLVSHYELSMISADTSLAITALVILIAFALHLVLLAQIRRRSLSGMTLVSSLLQSRGSVMMGLLIVILGLLMKSFNRR